MDTLVNCKFCGPHAPGRNGCSGFPNFALPAQPVEHYVENDLARLRAEEGRNEPVPFGAAFADSVLDIMANADAPYHAALVAADMLRDYPGATWDSHGARGVLVTIGTVKVIVK